MRLRSALGDRARKVTWLELFFDLIFVAAIAQVAEPLRHHYSTGEVVRLTPLFVLIWWAWTGHTVFATRFDSDDVMQRVLTLMQMFAVAAMAANAKDALDSRSSAGFAAAYAAVRFVLVGQYFRARQVTNAAPLATRYLMGHGTAAMLWLASALIPAPARFGVWTLAFVIDLGTPWFAARHSRSVPISAAHLPERFGLFMLILLGDSVVAVMQGMESQDEWAPGAATAAFLGMAILFLLWWWYFEGATDEPDVPTQTRRESLRFHVWSYAHLPLYLGVIVTGVGLRRIVTTASRTALEPTEALLLPIALALVMTMMTLIAATTDDRVRSTDWTRHLGLTALTISTGIAGLTSPVGMVMTLMALCVAQLTVTTSPSRASSRVEVS